MNSLKTIIWGRIISTYKNWAIPVCTLMIVLWVSERLIFAQTDCAPIAQQALETLDDYCDLIGRNQACYGNYRVLVNSGADKVQPFDVVGDIIDMNTVQSIRVAGYDEQADIWGLVLMRLQVSLPDAIPGQNVTFLLLGDVEMTHINHQNANPMQSFYLQTGVGNLSCENIPLMGS